MQRILSLPMSGPPTREEIEQLSRQYISANYFDGEEHMRFLDGQAWIIRDYIKFGGKNLGDIPVGGGKTLATLMIAQLAFRKGLRRIMLLMPPELRVQFLKAALPWARRRISIETPIIDLGSFDLTARSTIAKRASRGLYIMPYSLLSSRLGAHMLDDINPECVIADECHMIRARSSARTKRFLTWSRKHDFEFIPMSGTITSKTIMDYHHVMRLALKENSPMPDHAMSAAAWGDVVDSEASPNQDQIRYLDPLRAWAGTHVPGDYPPTQEGVRRAYMARLTTAPGIIRDETKIGTSLCYCNSEVTVADTYPGYQEMLRLIEKVQSLFLTPDDDEIQHAMLTWKWIEELSAGIYNRLLWPEMPPDITKRTLEHHALQNAYNKALRYWIRENGRKGLDTPFLVGQSMMRNGDKEVGQYLFNRWSKAREAAFDGMPERQSSPVRVCDYKIEAAARWAENCESKGGILWFHHQEIGRWLVERLERGPLAKKVLWAPAEGTRHGTDDMISGEGAAARCCDKWIVASIPAHHKGKNLQYMADQLIVQWPRSAQIAEQLVGRLHRTGQKAEHLDVCTMRSTLQDSINFAATINDALYIEQTTGARHKILYGDHDPLPRIYSPSFLEAIGLQPEDLEEKTKQRAQEQFGSYNDTKPA